MNRAFYNGISGTKSYQYGVDTWANNIANINTNGFKANIPQFADLFSDNVAAIRNNYGPVKSDQGFGVRNNDTAINLSQGSIEQTDRKLDIAIMGDGWFGVTGSEDDTMHFTRDGSFYYNRDGDIVNNDGGYLMGSLVEELNNGKLNAIKNYMALNGAETQEPMKLPQNLTLGAVPTQNVSIHGNLGVEGVTANYSTKIFTAEGKTHEIVIRIEKDLDQPDNESHWTMSIKIRDEDKKTIFESEQSKIIFGGNGAIKSFTPPKIDNSGVPIKLSLGENFDGLVALGGNFISKDITRDGVPEGKLTEYHLNRDGHLIANFDNGRESVVGKVAVFHFQNDQGLTKIGQNRFQASANSGDPFFYKNSNGENVLGTEILPYALEKSNTSAATALTQLIVMQKAFDANAKSITTGDQLIQTALKMV